MDKCTKHDETMDRVFNAISDLKIGQTAMSSKLDNVVEFKDLVHQIIFGNGRPGLKSIVEGNLKSISRLWGIILIILTATVTAGIIHFWR